MSPEDKKQLLPERIQRSALLIGTLFAWSAVVVDFMRFYDIEGTLFRIKDCAIPNPIVTPCFWGAVAFLIGFVLAQKILSAESTKRKRLQKSLLVLLVAGALFASTVNTIELINFYTIPLGETAVGCSGQIVSNPYTTPCFIGAVIFISSLISGLNVARVRKLSLKQ